MLSRLASIPEAARIRNEVRALRATVASAGLRAPRLSTYRIDLQAYRHRRGKARPLDGRPAAHNYFPFTLARFIRAKGQRSPAGLRIHFNGFTDCHEEPPNQPYRRTERELRAQKERRRACW